MLYPPEMMMNIVKRHGGGFILGSNEELPASMEEFEGYAVSTDPTNPDAPYTREKVLQRAAPEHGEKYLFVPHEVVAEAQKQHDFPGAVEELMLKHPHIPKNFYFPKGVLDDDDKRALILPEKSEAEVLRLDIKVRQKEIVDHEERAQKFMEMKTNFDKVKSDIVQIQTVCQQAVTAWTAAGGEASAKPADPTFPELPPEPQAPEDAPGGVDDLKSEGEVKLIFITELMPFDMPATTWLKAAVGLLPRDQKKGSQGYELDVFRVTLRHMCYWQYIDQAFCMQKIIHMKNGNKRVPKQRRQT